MKKLIESLKARAGGAHVLILAGMAAALVAYYLIRFGLTPPGENLYGDYRRRTTYVGPVRVRANVPLAPDKFVTLLALGGTLSLLGATGAKRAFGRPNPLSRLLQVAGCVALFPLGLYLLTFAGILLLLAMVVAGVWWLVSYIVKGG
jgi:hypothetical protein